MLSEILMGAHSIEPVQSRAPNKGFLFEKNLDFLITQEQRGGTRGGHWAATRALVSLIIDYPG